MAAKMDLSKKKCVTPEFRVSFPNVVKPTIYKGQTEPKYSIVMLFQKSQDLAPLREICANVLIEKFGEDKTRWPKAFKTPFRSGAEREEYEGYGPDVIFCSATSKTQPGLVNHKLERILDESKFYPGCYARAEIIAFWYDTNGNKGIGFSLQNVQKTRDGQSFSGKKTAENVFSIVSDGSDNPEHYAGGNGASAISAPTQDFGMDFGA